jgi:predicted HicB family RNase H-like nuclease
MNTLTYKGYTAKIEFDERDNILIGRLLGINDIIAFHADNVTDTRYLCRSGRRLPGVL